VVIVNAAEVTAIILGVPSILGAVTALIIAIKAHGKAAAAQAAVTAHVEGGKS
jgi:hypothetical protein